jgi:hypothetical protein
MMIVIREKETIQYLAIIDVVSGTISFVRADEPDISTSHLINFLNWIVLTN